MKKMIKAVIIDDEEHGRLALQLMLREYFPEIAVIDTGFNVQSGLEVIRKHRPDIVFLDIQMPDGSGFDMLHQLEVFNFEVIFTTAYSEYAIDAFQLPALGYLLKPIADDQLKTTVQRAINFLRDITDVAKSAETAPEVQLNSSNKLLLNNTDGFEVIILNQIIRLEGDRNYTKIHFVDKEPILSSHNLGWFEKLLSKNIEFFRASKSNLINLNHITRYTKIDGGCVFMTDHSQVHLAEGRKEKLKEYFLKTG